MASAPPRISSLDALRGVAVLGILLVNIQSFAFVSAARTNPTLQGDLGGAHWWVWLVTYVMFDGKFISLFGLLFGASIALLVDRSVRRGVAAAPIHVRRMAVLLVLGLLHAHLLWYGDWLVILAVSGAVAFLYHDLPPRRLLAAGVVVYAVGSLAWLAMAWWLARWAPDVAAEVTAHMTPSPEAIASEVARYRSGWLEQMGHRVPTALRYETSYLATRGLWQMTGLMLVGMGLLRLQVLTAARRPAFYVAMALGGLATGGALVAYGVSRSAARGWAADEYLAVDSHLNYWGGLLMTMGWIGSVMLLLRLKVNMRALAAVGRLALTNYLLQTVICTTIFYGHGLGLFGRVERVGQVGIVLCVWALQIALSVFWLRRFDQGPMEWVWRCLAYGHLVPIRDRAGAAATGGGRGG
jgi:uncharacterized protein